MQFSVCVREPQQEETSQHDPGQNVRIVTDKSLSTKSILLLTETWAKCAAPRYDYHLLDIVELGLESYTPLKDFKTAKVQLCQIY